MACLIRFAARVRGDVLGAAVCLTLALFASSALAQTEGASNPVTNVLGTATGTFTGTNTGCSTTTDNGPNSGSLTLVFRTQVGNVFGGDGSGTDRFGSFTLSMAGTVSGNVLTITATSTDPGGGQSILSGTATLTGDVLELQFTGNDVTGDTCVLSNGMATLTYQGDTFTASTSASSEGVTVDQVFTALRTNASIFSARFRNVRRGKLGLARIDDQGVMLSGNVNGAAAGGGLDMPLGVWASYVRTDSKNEFVTTNSSSKNNTFFAGVDFAPWDTTLIGVAIGFENGSTTTRFNGGSLDASGWTVAPYFGWFISENLSFDASGGITHVSIEQFRTNTAGARVTSDTDAVRLFATSNLTLTHQLGSLLLTGTGGLLWATQNTEGFRESDGSVVSESDADVGQFRFGGEVAYLAGNFEPYLGALYAYDFTRTRLRFGAGVAAPKNDNDDIQMSLGLRYYADSGLSGTVEYSRLLGRRDYREGVFTANVRWNY